MKALSGIILFSFLSHYILAQKIIGSITFLNSGKKPVVGARVLSNGANERISESDGSFTLIYIDKRAGNNIVLAIEKNGLEVVNKKDLKTTLSNSRFDTLKIFMTAIGDIDKKRIAYYNINQKTLTQKYNKKIIELRKANRASSEALAQLDEQYKNQLKRAEDLATKFSVINLDECSAMYRKAFAYYEKGDIDNAIATLDEDVIEEELKKAELEIKLAELLDSIANNKIISAQKALSKNNLSQALAKDLEKILQDKIKIILSAEQFERNEAIVIADLCIVRQDEPVAILLYEKVLPLMTERKDKAEIYQKLYSAYQKIGDVEKGKKALNLLEIYRH
jgi:tetratricopeptide (TPR) repeat protein